MQYGERYYIEFYAGVCEEQRTDNITIFDSLAPAEPDYLTMHIDTETSLYVLFNVSDVWEQTSLDLINKRTGTMLEQTNVQKPDPWIQLRWEVSGLLPGYVYKVEVTIGSYGKKTRVENEIFLPVQNLVPAFSKSLKNWTDNYFLILIGILLSKNFEQD